MTPQGGGHVRSHDKLNTLYIHQQNTYKYQIKKGVDLQWEALIFNATCSYDHVTNVRSRVNLKNLYFNYLKTYGQ